MLPGMKSICAFAALALVGCGPMPHTPVDSGAACLPPNGGFEESSDPLAPPDFWESSNEAWGVHVGLVAGVGIGDSKAISISTKNGSEDVGVFTKAFAISGAGERTASMWRKAVAGIDVVHFDVDWLDRDGLNIAPTDRQSFSLSDRPGTWVRQSLTAFPPVGAAAAQLTVFIEGLNEGRELLVDSMDFTTQP